MRTRMFAVCVVALAAFAAPITAQDNKPDAPPTIVVRVRSLENILDSVKLFGKLLGPDEVKKFDELIKDKLGPKGLDSINPRQPIGLYVRLAKELKDSVIVAAVPVADERAFLDMLAKVDLKAEMGQNDYYTIKQPDGFPSDVYLRFAHKYAYFTIFSPDHIAVKSLIAPAKLFPAKLTATFSATIRLDQIPEDFKNLIIQGLEQGLKLGQEDALLKKGASDKALEMLLGKELQRLLKSVLTDGTECGIELDLDAKKNEMRAEISLAGKQNSALAQGIAQLGQGKSLFAGLVDKNAALNGVVHFKLPKDLHEGLSAAVDEAVKKAIADAKDKGGEDLVKKIFDALTPSLKSGELDLGFSLRGPSPNKLYTLVGGVKLKDVNKLFLALLELHKALPEADRAKIELNADKVNDVAIPRVKLEGSLDEKTKKVFGEHPLYVALRKDALFVALGEDGLKAIKAAVVAPPAAAAPLYFDIALGRFALLMAKTEQEREAAQKLLSEKEDPRAVFAIEGGEALRIRFRMDLSAFRLIGMLSNPLGGEKKTEKN